MVTADHDRDDHYAPTRGTSAAALSAGGGQGHARRRVSDPGAGRPAFRGLRSGARQTFRLAFSRRLAAAADDRVGNF